MRRPVPWLVLGVLLPFLTVPTVEAAPAPRPVTPTTKDVALRSVHEPTRQVMRDGPQALSRRLAERADLRVLTPPVDAGEFSLVGVTWARGDAPAPEIHVRTKQRTGQWTAWERLEADEDGPDPDSAEAGQPGVREGTQPYWAGPSVQAQVAVHAKGALPSALRLALVDPGESPADELVTGAVSASTTTAETDRNVPPPDVITRAEWGADESMRDGDPTYGDTIVAGFVHHTAGEAPATPEESARIVRAIYAYHVNSNGWSDIGYNFLVDRFGQVFEGRYGGIDRPVVGAHAFRYNVDTFGVAALGDYETAHQPNTALLDAVERVAAYKLGMYDRDPHATALYTRSDGTVDTIDVVSGHRDVGNTVCPGARLYSRLPEIRDGTAQRIADAPPGGLGPALAGDFDGDGLVDAVLRAPGESVGTKAGAGTVVVVPSASGGPDTPASVSLDQDTPGLPGSTEARDGFGWATASGDFDGDRFADLAIGVPYEILGPAGGVAVGHGGVHVVYGSASGLLASDSQWLTIGDAGLTPADGDEFGRALAAGDLDGDGVDELVVGAPGAGVTEDGGVVVYGGSPDGLERTGALLYAQTQGLPADPPRGGADRLGWALHVADTTGDGVDDLVAGAPRADVGADDSGAVVVVPGSPVGLDTVRAGVFTQASPGVPGTAEVGDAFGAAITLGQLDGQHAADLAVSAPGEDIGVARDAGALTVLFAGAAGLAGDGARSLSQDTPGVPGDNESGDAFGFPALAAADLDADGVDDLVVSAVREDLQTYADTGAVTVLVGGPGGPFGHGAQLWAQDSQWVPGDNERADQFGSSLDVGRVNVGAAADLLIGVAGEDGAAGRAVLLRGGGAPLASSGGVSLSQGSPGVPGGPEAGDRLGS